MRIREVGPQALQFMVNAMLVKEQGGRIKKYRGQPVYSSCNHIDKRGFVTPHPYAFEFIVVGR